MTDPLGLIRDVYEEHLKKYGSGLAGALFGLGWFFFIDALVVTPSKVGFVNYLPGLAASLALLLINAVRLDEIESVDPWDDEGVYCRSRVWLLLSYLVCGGSIAGATVIMIASGGGGIGLAAVIQVACILGGALLFFVSRSEGENGGDASYGLL